MPANGTRRSLTREDQLARARRVRRGSAQARDKAVRSPRGAVRRRGRRALTSRTARVARKRCFEVTRSQFSRSRRHDSTTRSRTGHPSSPARNRDRRTRDLPYRRRCTNMARSARVGRPYVNTHTRDLIAVSSNARHDQHERRAASAPSTSVYVVAPHGLGSFALGPQAPGLQCDTPWIKNGLVHCFVGSHGQVRTAELLVALPPGGEATSIAAWHHAHFGLSPMPWRRSSTTRP
jgi:hypothetical protein